MPLLSSYYVEARVLDSQGNQGTSSTVIMQGPEPDTMTMTLPTTITTTNGTASVKIMAGQGNGYPSTVTLGVDPNHDGVFQTYTSAKVSSAGARVFRSPA